MNLRQAHPQRGSQYVAYTRALLSQPPSWVRGEAGQALALQSYQATLAFNAVLENICGAFQVPVADVEAAFRTGDFTPVPGLNVPLNVLLVLAWTWMGAPPPNGPDVHPNSLGYAVSAGAFAKRLGRP